MNKGFAQAIDSAGAAGKEEAFEKDDDAEDRSIWEEQRKKASKEHRKADIEGRATARAGGTFRV